MTRPEVAYHTSMLAKCMSDPTLECYELALALLLYLAHTPTIKNYIRRIYESPDCIWEDWI